MLNIIEVHDLYVAFPTKEGVVKAVNKIDLSIQQGEVLGILGESGSGKSVFGMQILGLIKDRVEKSGEVYFKGKKMSEMDKKEWQFIRGKEMGVIMQNPSSSLNPTLTIGNQIGEAIGIKEKCGRKERAKRAVQLLEKVKIRKPEIRAKEYPHQYSGGMKERAVIAMGIVQEPEFLIADEPTKGLDTLVKYQIVQLLKEISRGKTVMMITHDLRVAEEICTRIGVLYLGEFVEISPVKALYKEQFHPYTKGFFQSMPENGMLPVKGSPGSLIHLPQGCRFHDRCGFCMERCKKEHPPLYQTEDGRQVRCFLYA